jgi:hypothetical protein
VLGRGPSDEERSACRSYLADERLKRSPARARADLVHVLFNHNDFVTIR